MEDEKREKETMDHTVLFFNTAMKHSNLQKK